MIDFKAGEQVSLTLLPPYDTITYSGKLICHSLRTISDYIIDGGNPYKAIYQPKDIPINIYEQDLSKNVLIAVLQTRTGEIYHIPEGYIGDRKTDEVVAYSNKMIAVRLGKQRHSQSLAELADVVRQTVLQNTGIDSDVSVIQLGDVVNITVNDALLLESEREASKPVLPNLEDQISEKDRQLEILSAKLSALEKFATDCLGCCVEYGDCGKQVKSAENWVKIKSKLGAILPPSPKKLLLRRGFTVSVGGTRDSLISTDPFAWPYQQNTVSVTPNTQAPVRHVTRITGGCSITSWHSEPATCRQHIQIWRRDRSGVIVPRIRV